MLCAKLWKSLDLADCWVNMRVDGSPQWRVIGGRVVAQSVCGTKARLLSVGICQVAFECWTDGRLVRNRFSAVGMVADDWTVNIGATNVLQLCRACLFRPWSGAKRGRVTRHY